MKEAQVINNKDSESDHENLLISSNPSSREKEARNQTFQVARTPVVHLLRQRHSPHFYSRNSPGSCDCLPATNPTVASIAAVFAAALPASDMAPTEASAAPYLQCRYQYTEEDQRLISELQSWFMEDKLAQTIPAHVFAANPTMRKNLVEKLCRVCRVESSCSCEPEVAADTTTLPMQAHFSTKESHNHAGRKRC